MIATVFSLPYYLVIDGTLYAANAIGSLTISKAISGVGLGAVITQQLSATIYKPDGSPFSEGAAVKLYGWDALPTFYIESQPRTDNSVSITAYDQCRKLSEPFDFSGYLDGGMTVLIVGAIAGQCGFNGADNTSVINVSALTGAYLKGKSCTTILEDLGKCCGGYWYCTTDNKLSIWQVGEPRTSASAIDGKISKINWLAEKTITRLIITGGAKEKDIGSGGGNNLLTVNSVLFTDDIANQLAAFLLSSGGFSRVGVELTAVVAGNVEPYGQIQAGSRYITVTDISIALNALGAVATAKCPEMSADSEYETLRQREINQRVTLSQLYGVTMMDADGFALEVDVDGTV